MHHWDGWGWSWGMGIWMIVWWLLLFAAAVALVWLIVRATRGAGASPGPTQRETPEEIARRRFASGEIDREEYQRMIEDLRR